MEFPREAMERVREYDESDRLGKRNPYAAKWPDENLVRDWAVLAKAYLAEHDADSETPVDETILGAWGDNRDEFFYSEWNDSQDIRIVVKKDMRYAMIESGGEDGDVIFIPIPKTRGDVRQLCRALGIPLKESGND
jgi:hypothetical protein